MFYMTQVHCFHCNKLLYKSPSKVHPRNFCNHICYASVRNKELKESGKHTRLDRFRSEQYREKAVRALRANNVGEEHPMWKGTQASYRAIHYWVRRHLGTPTTCTVCNVTDTRPRYIQWANIDGHYRRRLTDYVPMCVSCHKKHDLRIARAKTDVLVSNQS